MRTQEEIDRALKKLRYKYKNKPELFLGATIHELYYYSQNKHLLPRDKNTCPTKVLEWLQGRRNVISKILGRIKI